METTYGLTVPEEGAPGGLCISCALLHHDFKEILGRGAGDDHFSEMPLPQAWIDGRRYRLLPYIQTQETTCRECNVRVPSLYVPAG